MVGFFITSRVVNLTLLEIFCLLVHIDVNTSCQILGFTNSLYGVEVQCLFSRKIKLKYHQTTYTFENAKA